jgi:hypothetical protein
MIDPSELATEEVPAVVQRQETREAWEASYSKFLEDTYSNPTAKFLFDLGVQSRQYLDLNGTISRMHDFYSALEKDDPRKIEFMQLKAAKGTNIQTMADFFIVNIMGKILNPAPLDFEKYTNAFSASYGCYKPEMAQSIHAQLVELSNLLVNHLLT